VVRDEDYGMGGARRTHRFVPEWSEVELHFGKRRAQVAQAAEE
jgi:hypothetical protein